MRIRTKLIAMCLVVSLIPVSVVGVVGVQEMDAIGSYAQERSTNHMEEQVSGELNNTVSARQAGIQNVLDGRSVDTRSLADSSPVQNYYAAEAGEWRLVQRRSQAQVGHVALQMHATVESTKRTVLESEYGGRSFDDLSPAEQRAVEARVERTLAGTSGDGVANDGTLAETFRPGYIGDTGYAYITDSDSNVVAHHSLDDGYNLREDASLAVFDDIAAEVESNPGVRNGDEWGIAEYEWEDTTQAGNPSEHKFIAYTYHEEFDWVLAPSVYYYELQTTASAEARDRIEASFRSYLTTRSVSIDGEDVPAYDEAILTDASGETVVAVQRTDGTISTEEAERIDYYEEFDGTTGEQWFEATKSLAKGEVHVSEVRRLDGERVAYVTTPVYRDDEFVGTVALRFDYGILSSMIDGVTVGDTGYLSIVNEEGRFVSHPDPDLVAGPSIANESYAGGLASVANDRVLAGQRGLDTYVRTDATGNESRYYAAYAPLRFGDRQFALLATVPEEDVTGPTAALGRELREQTASARDFFLLLIGAVAVVVVGVGYGAARYFSGPIERLRDRATALAAGRFDEESESGAASRDDELGELVAAFDDMEENLEGQVAELRRVSGNLGEGRLDEEVKTDLPGEFGAIMADLDEGVGKLRDGFGEIRRASRGIRAGELDQEVDTDLPGDYGAVLSDLDDGVDQLAHSFDEIRAASSGLREGNLDQRLDTQLPGAYGAVTSDLDAGIDEVERSLAEVRAVADRFAETSAEAGTSAAEVEAASEETATSVEEIAAGAERQTEQLQSAAGEMNDLSATIEEVASSADGVAETTSDAATLADRGREHASEATGEISAIEAETETAVEGVEGLGERVDEIDEIVGMITSIAEQTNLLALNASIEAARAGEAGDGFAVVADEIKTLASEAEEATDRVERLIDEIQADADETVTDMRSMRDRVETGSETIGDAIDLFDDVAEAIDEAESSVTEISEATEDQATSTEEVVAMVDEVASVSEETAAEANTVSAATEEQTAAVNEVTRNVQQVAESAESLQRLVDQFDVGDVDVDVDTRDAGAVGAAGGDAGDGTGSAVADGGQFEESGTDPGDD
ncbi:methyl-accepting chemotaxis protein [Candidatus Halobonum tyrrellensis]|uniref:Methyl-accepting chemotaxis protein n=1 Tax=Candidatus Halobonum tyrrellensis G22 TaxID=1324957 RepID=V4GXZ7_9EURY|nr:methyl-accepting chemotaxis protein [Candidatus Halobonum tyrrellensis]ESP90041.1 methyl-accepting chemotaxis protein [Candidatus Halobonum tyrrellensis G22]